MAGPDNGHPAAAQLLHNPGRRRSPAHHRKLMIWWGQPVRVLAAERQMRSSFLLIPVLDPGTGVLEVLDVGGDDRSAVLDGMCGDEDVSIVVRAAP